MRFPNLFLNYEVFNFCGKGCLFSSISNLKNEIVKQKFIKREIWNSKYGKEIVTGGGYKVQKSQNVRSRVDVLRDVFEKVARNYS